ncbi:MAG: methyl-accepting chemotaxis protein [Fibrobacterota bacterium]
MAQTSETAQRKKGALQSLKFKLIMASTGLVLLSVVVLTLAFIQRQKVQLRQQLVNRGETITRLLAYNARYGVQIGDKPILEKILGGVKDDPDVIYCLISDKTGGVIAAHNPDRADLKKIKPAFSVSDKSEIAYHNDLGDDVINMAIPVVLESGGTENAAAAPADNSLEEEFFGGDASSPEPAKPKEDPGLSDKSGRRIIGTVQVGVTLKNMNAEIAASIRRTVLISAIIVLAGFALAFWLGSLISAPIKKVVTLLTDISEGEGDLSQRIHVTSGDETGDLARGFNTFMDKFQEVKKISVFLNELGEGGGDLTKRLNIASQDEIGMLAKGFDRFTGKLHDIIRQVAENTERIAAASQVVSDTTIKLSRELNEVAGQSLEVAASSSQMSQGIALSSRNVSNVNDLMNSMEVVSNSGVEVVHETKNGMTQISTTIKTSSGVVERLNESSQKIGETIAAITEIADQTKLIAINAAIEASRVGAQGKGFAVVAEEIRRLAARVTKATQDISQRIKAVQAETTQVMEVMKKGVGEAENGLSLSSRSETSLSEISKGVLDAKSRIGDITLASREQTSAVGVITRNITGISESARQCSEGVSKAAQSMQELNKEVQELRQLVGLFVLDR